MRSERVGESEPERLELGNSKVRNERKNQAFILP